MFAHINDLESQESNNINNQQNQQMGGVNDMDQNLNQMDNNSQMMENNDLNGIIFTSEGLEYDSTLEMGVQDTGTGGATATADSGQNEQSSGQGDMYGERAPQANDLSMYTLEHLINTLTKGSMVSAISEGNPNIGEDGLTYKPPTHNPTIVGGTIQSVEVKDLYVDGENDGQDNPIHHNDVDQNGLGDCYFMATLAAIARNNPQDIRDMIDGPKEDGSYDVTLYVDGEATVFNVTPTFPTAQAVYDDNGTEIPYEHHPYAGAGDGEMWVMIMEKALAMYKGGFDESEGGYGDDAIELLTGKDADYNYLWATSDETLIATIKSSLENGKPIVADTTGFSKDKIEFVDSHNNMKTYLYGEHMYYVLDIDEGGNWITLRNPHNDADDADIQGGRELTISFDNFDEYFRRIAYQE